MEDDTDYTCIFYHKLCDLKTEELKPDQNERILKRNNIKLLTYNVFLRPPPVKNNESDWKDERLEEFCKVLHNYDIICLQEMFGAFNSRKQTLIRTASKGGFFFYIDTSSPSFVSKYLVDGGLLILSRFPIVSFSFCPYRYGVIADSLAQKGVLYAKILIKDCFLHLFTTHLQASYLFSGEYHFKVSCETRIAQLNQISFIMSEVLKSEYHKRDKTLLVGDFNVDAQKYFYKKPSGLNEDNQKFIEDEYNQMMDSLNQNGVITINSFHKHKNYHPITYADIDPECGLYEYCLTHKDDIGSRQTLDYIFECYFNEDINEVVEERRRLFIDPDGFRIEKFLINQEGSKKVFSQLSDHYGLSCELGYQKVEDGAKNEELDDDLNEEQKQLLKI